MDNPVDYSEKEYDNVSPTPCSSMGLADFSTFAWKQTAYIINTPFVILCNYTAVNM
jgi:hypothetical protein